MAIKCFIDAIQSEKEYEHLVDIFPDNPFYTSAYVNAMQQQEYKPFTISLKNNNTKISAVCLAFMRSKSFNNSLKIISLPDIKNEDTFWKCLLDYCKTLKISNLSLNSYAANYKIKMPKIRDKIVCNNRIEFILDLNSSNLWDNLSINHKKNIKRARKLLPKIKCVSDINSCYKHYSLINCSMQRSIKRHEDVADNISIKEIISLVQTNAGELFQLIVGEGVRSSVLVLLSKSGAYCHTAGTSPKFIAQGISHLLIYEVALILQKRGIKKFNLGGVIPENYGLIQFKTGFGTQKVEITSVDLYFGNRLKKRLSTFIRLVLNNPLEITCTLYDRIIAYPFIIPIYKVIDSCLERYHEKVIGIETKGKIYLDHYGITNSDCIQYTPVRYRPLYKLLNKAIVDYENTTLLDYGSGKGRVLFSAATLPLKKIIGVELIKELHNIALQNHRSSKNLLCTHIELIQIDATKYCIPGEVNVINFYNPFRGEVLSKVLHNIYCSLVEHPRKITIIAFNTMFFDEQVRYLDWIVKVYETGYFPKARCAIYETKRM